MVDLAKGHLAALDYADSHPGFMPINLGTGHGASVLQVADAYEKACGKPIPREIRPRRPGFIATSVADSSRAMELLHW